MALSQLGDRLAPWCWQRWPPEPATAEVLPSFVNAMADIEPLLVETDHRPLATEILYRVSQRSLAVLLTGFDAAALTEGLIPVLAPAVRAGAGRPLSRLKKEGQL